MQVYSKNSNLQTSNIYLDFSHRVNKKGYKMTKKGRQLGVYVVDQLQNNVINQNIPAEEAKENSSSVFNIAGIDNNFNNNIFNDDLMDGIIMIKYSYS
jgi:hypothetical protein